MGVNIVTSLVFRVDVRRPVVIRNRVDMADFVGISDRIPPPAARIWRDDGNSFQLEIVDRTTVFVNGKAVAARALRDGDELVVGSTVAIFRQAPALADLGTALTWESIVLPTASVFTADAKKVFDTVLLNAGLPRAGLTEIVVEDWRTVPLLGPHFGFGRIRSFHMDAGHTFGFDHSRWDVVGSGPPTLMRQRYTSIGLPGAVLKWEISRQTRDFGSPFSHTAMVLGWSDHESRDRVLEAVRSKFGADAQLGSIEDSALWNMHHTDRILALPGSIGKAPDDGIYCTISRLG